MTTGKSKGFVNEIFWTHTIYTVVIVMKQQNGSKPNSMQFIYTSLTLFGASLAYLDTGMMSWAENILARWVSSLHPLHRACPIVVVIIFGREVTPDVAENCLFTVTIYRIHLFIVFSSEVQRGSNWVVQFGWFVRPSPASGNNIWDDVPNSRIPLQSARAQEK